MKKRLVMYIVTVIGVIILGTVLIIGSYLINTKKIQENFSESKIQMKNESEYERIDQNDTSTLDNFTDSLMLLTASYSGNGNLIECAMNNYRISKKGSTPYYTMIDEIDEEEITVKSYSRYWHGYLIVLKPLLYFFNYSQIRIINTFCQILLTIVLLAMMYKRKIGLFIIPFLTSYIMINPMAIANSLQYSTIWYITIISMLVYLIFKDRIVANNLHYLLFTIVGMITSYMDLLTYPIATLGMLMVLVLITENLNIRKSINMILICCFCWGLGYGIMWVAKWALASILLNENVFKTAIEAIQSRSSNTYNSGIEIERKALFKKLFKIFNNNITEIIIWINFIGYLVYAKFSTKGNKFKKIMLDIINNKKYVKILDSIPVLLVAFIPFVWYFALTNHSYMHTFFTFRSLVVFWFAVFSSILKIIKDLIMKELLPPK